MKRSEVNTDQERAQKRALSDFRCAVRKLAKEAEDAKDPTLALMIKEAAEWIESLVEAVRGSRS